MVTVYIYSGLWNKCNDKIVSTEIRRTEKNPQRTASCYAERMHSIKINLPAENVLKHVVGGSVACPHASRALVEKAKEFSSQEAIQLIRKTQLAADPYDGRRSFSYTLIL